ncbi:hypothetical protein [Myxococcus sp. SDU36]|uniref:hypothetical protein n=1 Tax=Myxococcus sp. SDU36 TaxID=2831967 RepID=UPI0025430F49|nr:hypothetical protein [Myxococcus sp. SDU36]WIG97261.1 hypothetical protein KGD87_07695 [Myxococcus sp. SDU36]
MRSPTRRQPSEAPEAVQARLSARIAALEDRVRRLEARLRLKVAATRPVTEPAARKPAARKPAQRAAERPVRVRPRCPGCTLELPRGRRGESCVWCGFVFSAVTRRRPARKKR